MSASVLTLTILACTDRGSTANPSPPVPASAYVLEDASPLSWIEDAARLIPPRLRGSRRLALRSAASTRHL